MPQDTLQTLQCGMGWFPQQAGGLNRMYYNLTRFLPDAGVDVIGLVTGVEPTAHATNGRETRARVEAFAATDASLPSRWRGARRSARRLLASNRISVVASHFALYTFPLLDLTRSWPLVVHFHGPWAHEGLVENPGSPAYHMKRALENVVYRRADRFIVLSRAFGSVLHERYGIPHEQIRVVPGGVDANQFDASLSRHEARERLGWPTDRPILLSVRRLARRMGLENLIEAVAAARERIPELLLFVAGRGPLQVELQERIVHYGLEEHVTLLGYVPDDRLALLYRAADLSVVPTVSLEGFGLITLESLAAGTPVLVTPVGGLPEAVSDLSDALVLPDIDPRSMGERVVSALLGSVAMPSESACRAYARARFDWSVIAAQTRLVYEEVLA
jgi:glycogen synthase